MVLSTLLLATQGIAAERVLSLASTDYPPYYGKGLKNHGPISEITLAAYRKVDWEVKITFLPWARAMKEAKTGGYDGISGIWYRKDREAWFVFSDPIYPNIVGFYKRKGKRITFTNYEDLSPYRIGVVRGYTNPPAFEKADLQKQEVTTDEQNLRKLVKHRIDLALIDKEVARYIIDTKFPHYAQFIEWMEPTLETIFLHLAISKAAKHHERKLRDFNRGLKLIAEDGTLLRIMETHGFRSPQHSR
jgi:polar amino acid transport system substrate-binding protein